MHKIFEKQLQVAISYILAKKDPQEQPAYIHPSCAVFNHQPDWLIFHHLIPTTKEYMRECMVIDPKWLILLAPRYFEKADPIKLSKRKQIKETIGPLYNKYEGKDARRLSRTKIAGNTKR